MFDIRNVRTFPLSQRNSLTRIQDILVPPDLKPPLAAEPVLQRIDQCARDILKAKSLQSQIILIYGAHFLRNGASLILGEMMKRGWITHLATNGAGTIHDWEYSFQGLSTESVRENVATGTFGTWTETGENIHLALLVGALNHKGYGHSLGQYIWEETITIPRVADLENAIRNNPSDPLTPARSDFLQTLLHYPIPPGPHPLPHPWKHASILGQAYAHNIPLSVHPGIGYDIIANHPIFNGAVIGRAAALDFQSMAQAVSGLENGVTLSIGSAIMGPQVFEKTLSCVNNLRIQNNQAPLTQHTLYVVDLQDGGNWDWTQGEPPKTNPAYYLRFCKSYSRMGGAMHYLQSDNLEFIQRLYHRLLELSPA